MMRANPRFGARCPGGGMLALLLVFVAGCSSSRVLEMQESQRLATRVRASLGTEWPTAEYQQERTLLLEMGPEIDPILVAVAQDRRARIEARADALVLLGERRSPLALPTLRSALQSSNERIRAAAVLGLHRLSPDAEPALELVRFAAEDPSRTVRLQALQSLEIRDVETIRALLERESDPEVRRVAFQLVSLAEARGAPLIPDRRGALRSAGSESEPQIVFRPVSQVPDAPVLFGDLRVELPDGPDIPLASSAEVVGNVVPAFFSPDRSAVVTESDGEIVIVQINSRARRSLGEGLAPRLIPFTQQFVFLRERPESQHSTASGIAIVYDVYRASFNSRDVEEIGSLRAVTSETHFAGESPVRWMVVAEAGEGFVLRGDNLDTFELPTRVWTAGHGPERP